MTQASMVMGTPPQTPPVIMETLDQEGMSIMDRLSTMVSHIHRSSLKLRPLHLRLTIFILGLQHHHEDMGSILSEEEVPALGHMIRLSTRT